MFVVQLEVFVETEKASGNVTVTLFSLPAAADEGLTQTVASIDELAVWLLSLSEAFVNLSAFAIEQLYIKNTKIRAGSKPSFFLI